jgi:hypothetical protein
MKPLKSKISVTLDDDIIAAIRRLAELDDRSFSQYINLILKKHLQSIEGEPNRQVTA